jgi:hypothetical protein
MSRDFDESYQRKIELELKLKHILEIHPDYNETLVSCVIALDLLYKDDPIRTLQSDEYKHYNHGIKKLIKSQ